MYVDLQTVFGFIEGLAGSNPSMAKVKPYLDAFTSLVAGTKNGVVKIVVNVKQGSAAVVDDAPDAPSTTETNADSGTSRR